MKRFTNGIFALFLVFLAILSCNREDFSFSEPSQALRFSRDTVFCDTVYNAMRSETYSAKVYNAENNDVKIPHIFLEGGSASPYRINVDGKSGTDFTNVPVRKKDSLFIFVEIAPVANAKEAIAEDRIIFETPAGKQSITLFSVVQDAEYFIESAKNPNIISQNTTWDDKKAKIIFGNLTVAEGKILSIQPGTKVYFHKNSGLKISKNATLNVNGAYNNEVIFRGDRNDTRYDTIPKNWNSIVFDPGSNLAMNYAKVFGGTSGLSLTQASANITNSIIHTFQDYGILAVNSSVNAKNLVMNNCGQADFAIFKGGSIDLTHCTLANFWNLNSSLPAYGIYATNEWQNPLGQTENAALNLSIKNSIIYTESANAVQMKPIQGQTFNYLIDSSILKYGNNAGFAFDANPFVINSIKSTDNNYPKFLNYYTQKMNLRVATDSPAKGKGKLQYAQAVPQDIVQVSRTSNPTIGAYQ